MNPLDTLQIVIEADTHALEATLKGTIGKVQGMIDVLNSNEINWKKIMTQSISPALISGVAATFALALTSAMQFQQNVTKVGETLGLSGGALTAFNEEAQSVAETTGQSSGDIAKAMARSYPAFKSQADAFKFIEQAAKLATLGYGSIGEIVDSTLPLIQQWGADTADSSTMVLNSLMKASNAAGTSISTIATSFESFTPSLIFAGTKLSSFSDLAITFGVNVGKMGLSMATGEFNALAKAMSTAGDPLGNLSGGMAKLKTLVADGNVEGALKRMADVISTQFKGKSIQEIADALGLSVTQVDAFIKTEKDYPSYVAAIKTVKSEVDLTTESFEKLLTVTDKAKIFYQQFLGIVKGDTKQAADAISGIWENAAGHFQKAGDLAASGGGLGKTLMEVLKGVGTGALAPFEMLGVKFMSAIGNLINPNKSSGSNSNNADSNGQTTNKNLSTGNITINQYISGSADAKGVAASTSKAIMSGLNGIQ